MKDQTDLKADFSHEDRQILKAHEAIIEGIALFMGDYCEVALQSLEDPDHAVLKIINNHHTKRKSGDPLTDHGRQVLQDFESKKIQRTSCYTTMSVSSDPMRSVFTVICHDNKPIGLLDINFNMNVPLAQFMSTFSLFNNCAQPPGQALEKSASSSVGDLVHNAVTEVVQRISTDTNIPNHDKNKYIVFGLHEEGIFDIKGAVVMVAEELGLSKFTIYSYIRELKEKKSN
ncbi:MAG: hypothetical protein GY780_10350 [bacterium]|nr:hypothetical protein [bacterium]